ncbi:hypothetical protein ASZ90_010016 [hydrocarbon metagenome]|uniref:Uncharacterized protein n=1 Tax=hydrocarbon metagenome TaxID=938273 RepID=A0A0W8FIW0_9ZZZZ
MYRHGHYQVFLIAVIRYLPEIRPDHTCRRAIPMRRSYRALADRRVLGHGHAGSPVSIASFTVDALSASTS